MRTLYHSWLCPFSRKIRILLGEKKLDHKLKVERSWALSPEFTSLNPGGSIPVLQDVGEVVVCQHPAIAEYLEEAYPERPLLAGDIYQRAEVRRLISWFDEIFNNDVTQKIVYEKTIKRHVEQTQPSVTIIRTGLTNIHKHLSYIEQLIDSRNWLAGDHFSLADVAAAAHFSCVDFLGDVPWDKYPIAKEWYVRIKSRPSFRSLLNDNMPGVTPASHYANLDF
ncbi:MAG: glutathione S-transferase family protein [Alphaproteobacteria bacterium]|nr:glutathione S-transferase family protein [Alphaproteobacteria bacterium]